MVNMKLRLLIVLGFILVGLFGFALCELLNDDTDDVPVITFLHNGSLSGIMPITPGYNIVIDVQNNATIRFVKDDFSVSYVITEDGFRHHNYSKGCYE